jgi:hypothetical protein
MPALFKIDKADEEAKDTRIIFTLSMFYGQGKYDYFLRGPISI